MEENGKHGQTDFRASKQDAQLGLAASFRYRGSRLLVPGGRAFSLGRLRAMKAVHFIFAAVMVALAGCKSSSSSSISLPSYSWSESLMSREIHLSPKHPADSDAKIRLVSVASDSTTTIRLDTGEQFSAKPGEYFACEQFGSHGLQLVSATPQSGAAELQQRWSETR
jgi:hypothetical protein